MEHEARALIRALTQGRALRPWPRSAAGDAFGIAHAFGTAHVNDTAVPMGWEPLARPLPQCLCADTDTFAGFVDDPDYDTYSMAGSARMPLHYQVRLSVGARASR